MKRTTVALVLLTLWVILFPYCPAADSLLGESLEFSSDELKDNVAFFEGHTSSEKLILGAEHIKICESERLDSPILYEFSQSDEIVILDAFTKLSENPITLGYSPYPQNCLYVNRYNVRSNDIEGWVSTIPFVVNSFVRFDQHFSDLREGPSLVYSLMEHEPTDEYDIVLKPEIETGEVYRVLSIFNDWVCVGRSTDGVGHAGGWLPIETPGLQFYIAAIECELVGGESMPGSLVYYIPYGFGSKTIYELYSGYAGTVLSPGENKIAVIDKNENEIVFESSLKYRDPIRFDMYESLTEYSADAIVSWPEVKTLRFYIKDEYTDSLHEEIMEFDNGLLPVSR